MTSDILDYFRGDYSHSDVEGINSFFNQLNRQIPQKNGFFKTSDGGALVLITEFSCAVRITSKSVYPSILHPRFLRPLLYKTTSNLHIGLNPGVKICPEKHDRQKFEKIVEEEGMIVPPYECHPHNVATFDNADEYKVIIDPGSYCGIDTSIKNIKLLLHQASSDQDEQGLFFKELKKCFLEAWPEENKNANPYKMKIAWEACKDWASQGRLAAPWTVNTYFRDYAPEHDTMSVAQNYANLRRT